MSLSAWDKIAIEELAYSYRVWGREPAKNAYHKFAASEGWHSTPDWVEGRTIFWDHWVACRKAHNEYLAERRVG